MFVARVSVVRGCRLSMTSGGKGCSGRLGRCEVESDGCGDAETIIAAKDGPSALLSAVFKGSTVALALEWPALKAVYAREI